MRTDLNGIGFPPRVAIFHSTLQFLPHDAHSCRFFWPSSKSNAGYRRRFRRRFSWPSVLMSLVHVQSFAVMCEPPSKTAIWKVKYYVVVGAMTGTRQHRKWPACCVTCTKPGYEYEHNFITHNNQIPILVNQTSYVVLLLGQQLNNIGTEKAAPQTFIIHPLSTNMANFLPFPANTHNALLAVSPSGASCSSEDRYRRSLPLPSMEKLQINIHTDSMASSAIASTAACTDAGSIDSFMNSKCDTTSSSSTSSTTPCGAAAKDDADMIPSQTTNNSRCTLDQALENLMQRRQSERHHLSIARDLLERLEDDEEDFSSDDDSDDDEESAQHMHISTTCTRISTSRASTSKVRMPNIERGLRSLAQPRRRERHPFAVAEFFLQDLEEEER